MTTAVPRRRSNVLRVDPTRTTFERRKFVAKLQRQFAKLKARILVKVSKDNALGLTANARLAGSLGVKRENMPQVPGAQFQAFLEYMAKNGVNVTRENAETTSLKPIQSEFRQERVDALALADVQAKPILVSRDSYVLDGLHRWIKVKQSGVIVMPVLRLSVDAVQAIGLMERFPGVAYKANQVQPQCSELRLVEVPDIRQEDHYSCGAACSMSVGQYYGVGPGTLEGWKRLLGTNVHESTHPQAIEQVFSSLGLDVEARDGLSVSDLADYTQAGIPVVCCVQDYGPAVPAEARFAYGHYLVVIGVGAGYVFCQDPSEDNVIAGGDGKKLATVGSVQKPGRIMVDVDTWQRIWHDEDAEGAKYVQFGIAIARPGLLANEQWAAKTSAAKVEAFQKWLQQQYGGLLTGESEEALWKRYIEDGFRKGAGRAFDDAIAKLGVTGDREQFLRQAFAQPETRSKVELLAGRAFDDLEGVTDSMSLVMSRTLTDAVVQGMGPMEAANAMVAQVDIGFSRASTIARTELIRAHAEGQLNGLEDMGVGEVGVEVEWATADDDAVCPKCAELEGSTFSITEARGMIPLHPNCRCAFIPAGEPVGT